MIKAKLANVGHDLEGRTNLAEAPILPQWRRIAYCSRVSGTFITHGALMQSRVSGRFFFYDGIMPRPVEDAAAAKVLIQVRRKRV